MNAEKREALLQAVEKRAVPFQTPLELAPLIEQLSSARIVMLGEATHGTHEFYEWRRMISEWLIVKHGFRFIAVEGEWPSCRALNHYVHAPRVESIDESTPQDSREALEAFHRWPTWMWANTEMIRMSEWLRSHNERVPAEKRAHFHGLDLYSMFESMDVVIHELEKVNLFYARQARQRYACFAPHGRDEIAYARSLLRLPESCEDQVVSVLKDLLALRMSNERKDYLFDAEQNARVVQNAEHYYRATVHADEDSWNIRDQHMIETLSWLLQHHGPDAKAIVWAHNTHIGDYRATPMKDQGLVNLGGLAREAFDPRDVFLLGFGSYEGQVTASHAWDGPIQTMALPPAREDSLEGVLHDACKNLRHNQLYLDFRTERPRPGDDEFLQTVGHRAVGVVYNPTQERRTNYVPTQLARRYDAFIHIDRTHALQPLVLPVGRQEFPETWPTGA